MQGAGTPATATARHPGRSSAEGLRSLRFRANDGSPVDNLPAEQHGPLISWALQVRTSEGSTTYDQHDRRIRRGHPPAEQRGGHSPRGGVDHLSRGRGRDAQGPPPRVRPRGEPGEGVPAVRGGDHQDRRARGAAQLRVRAADPGPDAGAGPGRAGDEGAGDRVGRAERGLPRRTRRHRRRGHHRGHRPRRHRPREPAAGRARLRPGRRRHGRRRRAHPRTSGWSTS